MHMDERREDEDEAAAMPVAPVRHHAALAAPDEGDVLVSASVGPSGEAIALWSAAADGAALAAVTTLPNGVGSPDSRTRRPVPVHVVRYAPQPVQVTSIAEFVLAHTKVQPLPKGEVLAVAARSRWRPAGAERNAMVYDADGAVRTEQVLGDGIKHVLTTPEGEAWVGYFDEGVFGNNGWGRPGSEEPVGGPGLIRFSRELRPQWRYPSGLEWGSISDCYALNVDGESAWCCYYSGFPVVRATAGTVAGWNSDVAGVSALAVGGSRIALVGRYGPVRGRLAVGELGTDRVHVTSEVRLVLPDGQPLPPHARVVGRGPDLHVLAGEHWYRLGLADLPHD